MSSDVSFVRWEWCANFLASCVGDWLAGKDDGRSGKKWEFLHLRFRGDGIQRLG